MIRDLALAALMIMAAMAATTWLLDAVADGRVW